MVGAMLEGRHKSGQCSLSRACGVRKERSHQGTLSQKNRGMSRENSSTSHTEMEISKGWTLSGAFCASLGQAQSLCQKTG